VDLVNIAFFPLAISLFGVPRVLLEKLIVASLVIKPLSFTELVGLQEPAAGL
jgi:hypothetical protein